MAGAPLRIAVLGYGGRAQTLTRYALEHPDQIAVAAVAEPTARRRAFAVERFGDSARIFSSGEQFYDSGMRVDGVWVISQEKTHADLAVPALERGLPLICEKPLATTLEDAYRICDAHDANPVPFVIPHSLRYLPKYRKIRECVESGVLGRIMHIHAVEAVADKHTVSYYRRGPARLRADTTILLAKSSHDLDIINWMMGGVKAEHVACFGGLDYFRPRPEAPARCSRECPDLAVCPYGPHGQKVDAGQSVKIDADTEAVFDDRMCAWNSGGDQADHQTLILRYEDGTTADFTLKCFGGGGRPIQITGTHGSVFGDQDVRLQRYRPPSDHVFTPEEMPPAHEGPHGGGDWALIDDWRQAVTAGRATHSATVHESAEAVAVGVAADIAMTQRRVVHMPDLRRQARERLARLAGTEGAKKERGGLALAVAAAMALAGPAAAAEGEEFPKPYSAPCTEREEVFEFTEKPSVRSVGSDRYEIAFAVKGNCDVTVAIVDGGGAVVRHLASGVLGANAPAPLRQNSLEQKLLWNGKDDLGEYVKEPGKLKVRVMLGMKPRYDRRLGGRSPHNLPGYVCGLAVGPGGAVVFSKRWRLHARRFDLDGEYAMSLWPPPANLPPGKLAGMGYVEYEPGKRAVHGPTLYDTVSDRGWMFWGVDHGGLGDVQPAMWGDRVYFVGFNGEYEGEPAPLYYLKTDGTTDYDGVRGVPFSLTEQRFPRMAVSPDGNWLYMTGGRGANQFDPGAPVVLRRSRTGPELAAPFLGNISGKAKGGHVEGVPGADNGSLNGPGGIDCDGAGRIYVCDQLNNRVQVFAPEGSYLKTVAVDRPLLIRVHQKTGAIYVLHVAREHGRSVNRLTRFGSFDDPREVFHRNDLFAGVFALDSWSARPRLWLAGGEVWGGTGNGGFRGGDQSVAIWEDTGEGLRKLVDFDERARRDDGPAYPGRWRNEKGGSGGATRIDCDPLHETAYVHADWMFDLPTGRFLGRWKAAPHRAIVEDLAFDKRGYMHIHFNPGFYLPGVGRVDASKPTAYSVPAEGLQATYYPPIPYDYGVEGEAGRGPYWRGILPVRDQLGAKYFQDGLGVNMKGDVVVQSNIYYVPRMEDAVIDTVNEGATERKRSTGFESTGGISYQDFMHGILERQKRGEEVYSIRRQPGIPLFGATAWTYEASGALRSECAATVGRLVNGVEIDEEGRLYMWCNKMRVTGAPATPFLHGKGGTFGGAPARGNLYPMTGTFMKTRGAGVRILRGGAVVPVEPLPDRAPDLIDTPYAAAVYEKASWAWAEGAEWMYAGASPITFRGCSCPSPRFCTDWYRRSFVPEAYRHSIAVLDTNGNLVMHIGQYGNLDSADGPASRIHPGGDGIGMFHPRAVGATDNYVVFSSWEEWVTALAIGYHAEETAAISVQ